MAKIIEQIQQNDKDMRSIEQNLEWNMMKNGISITNTDMSTDAVDILNSFPNNPGDNVNQENLDNVNQENLDNANQENLDNANQENLDNVNNAN